MSQPRCAAALTLVLLLAACGTDRVTGPKEPEPEWPALTPRPLHATPVLDDARAVSARVVPETGGTLTATGADGTVYTLTIPHTALDSTTTITMTPLLRLDGVRFRDGGLYGVDLAPHGMRFYDHVTLDIRPTGGARRKAFGLGYGEGGRDLHGYPLVRDPNRLAMQLMHFSGVLVQVGEGVWVAQADLDQARYEALFDYTPDDVEAQLEHLVAELINEERNNQLEGRPSDPEFNKKLDFYIRAYYVRIIEPTVARLETDCRYADDAGALARAINWKHMAAVLGYDFRGEDERISTATGKAAENCLKEAIGTCVVWEDPRQRARVIGYMRSVALLTGSEPPWPDGCQIWVGTSRRTNSGSYLNGWTTSMTEYRVVWGPSRSQPGDGWQKYEVVTGEIKWEIEQNETHTAACDIPHTSGMVEIDRDNTYGWMEVSADSVIGDAVSDFETRYMETCNVWDGRAWVPLTVERVRNRGGLWWATLWPHANDIPNGFIRGQLRDRWTSEYHEAEETIVWNFIRKRSSIEDVLGPSGSGP